MSKKVKTNIEKPTKVPPPITIKIPVNSSECENCNPKQDVISDYDFEINYIKYQIDTGLILLKQNKLTFGYKRNRLNEVAQAIKLLNPKLHVYRNKIECDKKGIWKKIKYDPVLEAKGYIITPYDRYEYTIKFEIKNNSLFASIYVGTYTGNLLYSSNLTDTFIIENFEDLKTTLNSFDVMYKTIMKKYDTYK